MELILEKQSDLHEKLCKINKEISKLETEKYNIEARINILNRVSKTLLINYLLKEITYLTSKLEGTDYIIKLIPVDDNKLCYICKSTNYSDEYFKLATKKVDSDPNIITTDDLMEINPKYCYISEFIESVLNHQISKEYYLFDIEMRQIANEIIDEYKPQTRIK